MEQIAPRGECTANNCVMIYNYSVVVSKQLDPASVPYTSQLTMPELGLLANTDDHLKN